MWSRLVFRTRLLGRDAKFFYIEHLMIADGAPAANVACRTVIIRKGGLVPPAEVVEEMGATDWDPDLPDWVADWAAADDRRPWPPQEFLDAIPG